MLQFWNLFNASVFGTNHSVFKDSRHALGMLSVAIIILVGQILIVEFGGKVFRTEPMDFITWIYIIAGTSFVLWIGEIYRWIKRIQKKRLKKENKAHKELWTVRLKNVVFDLGGVLINLDFDNCLNAFRKAGFRDIEKQACQFRGKGFFSQFELGEISPEEFRKAIRKEVSEALSDHEIDDMWNLMLLDIPRENWTYC